MKIEVMIYVYLIICAAMIGFNITSAVLARRRDKKLCRVSQGFTAHMMDELKWLAEHGAVRNRHKVYLTKKLKRIGNMQAFDQALENAYTENPLLVQKYLHTIGGVFVSLAIEYSKREPIEAAYFPYILKKYRLLSGRPFDAMIDMLYILLQETSIYCRENAMQAIYTIGDPACVVKALRLIDEQDMFYHNKLITDGLLHFDGNTKKLDQALWAAFEDFSVAMQITLINYFRFSTGNYCARILQLMTDPGRDDELRFACIRYFGKYPFAAAYPHLLQYANSKNGLRWEYAAIASSVLCAYPSDQTTAVLKQNLYHRNWYIRFNASQSLEKMGLTYLDLIDIVEGNDRYAAEILRYRFDVRDIRAEERRGEPLHV